MPAEVASDRRTDTPYPRLSPGQPGIQTLRCHGFMLVDFECPCLNVEHHEKMVRGPGKLGPDHSVEHLVRASGEVFLAVARSRGRHDSLPILEYTQFQNRKKNRQ